MRILLFIIMFTLCFISQLFYAEVNAGDMLPASPKASFVPDSGQEAELCRSLKITSGHARVPTNFEKKLRRDFGGDEFKIGALLFAVSGACSPELIDLKPTAGYVKLLELLAAARNDFESRDEISAVVLKKLEAAGVVRQKIRGGKAWRLVIDRKAKEALKIRTAASLAGAGYLYVEAYHQLFALAGYDSEKQVLLRAVEKTADEIIRYSDENNDGRTGWGRLWFKGSDGLLLHLSEPDRNMYFGGYTYFPRADSSGKSSCERSRPLAEETYDHAQNAMFLLEAFLVTRNRGLAERIIMNAGKSFDDTFDEGAIHKQTGNNGWYYWKQLGKRHNAAMEKCDAGREIKNTNLKMGSALLAFSQILKMNEGFPGGKGLKAFKSGKYADRAMQIIRTNNYEIFEKNNFGYQGFNSRIVEREQAREGRKGMLVYDRTQVTADFSNPAIGPLKNIISEGNRLRNIKQPSNLTICGGSIRERPETYGIAMSCWSHLAMESEDYFRIARLLDLWRSDRMSSFQNMDALTRNLAAAYIVPLGLNSMYSHYSAGSVAKKTHKVITPAYYAYFCMARNIYKKDVAASLPEPHRKFLAYLPLVCGSIPGETADAGTGWKKGHRFYELYLAGDRFHIPVENWYLKHKK
jgi:hypothetical protein